MIERILKKIRGKILSSYKSKRVIYNLLKTPLFADNYLYKFFYLKNVKNKISAMVKKPLFLQIENTNSCNLSCIFCPHENMKRKRGDMPQELFESIIKQCIKYDISNIIITGFGEPLVDQDYIEKIRFAKEQGIKNVYCVTNGTLLSKETSANLIKAGLDFISFSIDAATPDIYGRIHRIPFKGLPYDKISALEENIDNLIELKKRRNSKKPFIEIRFREFELNKKELKSFIKKYSKKADKVVILMNIFSWPGSCIENNLPKRSLLRFPCYNLWSTLYINYDGKVSLCCQDYENRIELGDVNKENIMEIWHGKKFEEIRSLHLKNKYCNIAVCKDCVINTYLVTPWWQ